MRTTSSPRTSRRIEPTRKAKPTPPYVVFLLGFLAMTIFLVVFL
jgi:hypothetical protein